MQISKKSQYGLRAMVYLAKQSKKSGFSPLKDVSEKEGISFDFLEKILTELERAKLIKSKKGVGGGYILTKKIDKITAKDIVEVLEKTSSVDCSLCGRAKKCLTKSVWSKLDTALSKTLKSITLADLIR